MAAGGDGLRVAQMHVCVADTDRHAQRMALRWWRHGGLPPKLFTELARPEEFAAAAALVREDDVARAVLCSSDPAAHVAALGRFAEAGFDRVYVHQVGPDQEALFELYRIAVFPRLG